MDLGLEIIQTNGRKKVQLATTISRQLGPDDLVALTVERDEQKPISTVKRLSDRHHNLARLLAAGKPDWEAAIITGYGVSRISILKGDPAFQDLLRFYRMDQTEAMMQVREKYAAVSSLALDEILNRLEDEPEKVPLSRLEAIAAMAGDRSGNGPASTSTNVNVNMNVADRLESARKRVAERMLDAKAMELKAVTE